MMLLPDRYLEGSPLDALIFG